MAAVQGVEGNDDDNNVLVAFADNTRNISLMLKSIHFKDVATFCATPDGLKVTVEDSKCLQGHAYIQASLFYEYILKTPGVTFTVNLSVLLECLNIFGSNTNPNSGACVKICFAGYGSPLVLYIEENGVLTICNLKTLEPETVLDFEFAPSSVVNKIIMKSELLREAWTDLDMNCDFLEIFMSPNEPHFQLTTKGVLGSIHATFSNTNDMVESFQCNQTQKNRYRISLIKTCLKALVQSSKISIRTDDKGFLCLQYMIKTEGVNLSFAECICAPNELENDIYELEEDT